MGWGGGTKVSLFLFWFSSNLFGFIDLLLNQLLTSVLTCQFRKPEVRSETSLRCQGWCHSSVSPLRNANFYQYFFFTLHLVNKCVLLFIASLLLPCVQYDSPMFFYVLYAAPELPSGDNKDVLNWIAFSCELLDNFTLFRLLKKKYRVEKHRSLGIKLVYRDSEDTLKHIK